MSEENSQIEKKNTDNNPEGKSNCPVCGYYVGSGSTCVRCGARVGKRISIRIIKKMAIICSVVGLILLWIAAYNKKPPRINIGDITETMNNALVEVEGEVKEVEYQEEKNSFNMTIDDGTGKLSARAINDLKNFRSFHKGNMPGLKDKVNLVGTLNISQTWGVSMFLSIPDRMELVEDYEIKEEEIRNISSADKGEIYWIEADIKKYVKDTPREGLVLHKITLSDGTGDIEMVFYESTFEGLPEKIKRGLTKEGTPFKMKVRADEYRGTPQLELVNPRGRSENIQLLDDSAVEVPEKVDLSSLEEVKASEISSLDKGKKYLITAKVDQVSLGVVGAYLELSNSEMPVFISYDQREKIENFSDLESGKASVTAPVKVSEVDGEIQLELLDTSEFNIK
ncbi:MAG: hypothetical protein ACQEQC_02605 [Elusimicrobiota bacterium]